MTLATLYMVDNCLLAKVTKKRYLEKIGCEIIGEFSSIIDCANAISKTQPDVILLDTDMLSTDSKEEMKLLKNISPTTLQKR